MKEFIYNSLIINKISSNLDFEIIPTLEYNKENFSGRLLKKIDSNLNNNDMPKRTFISTVNGSIIFDENNIVLLVSELRNNNDYINYFKEKYSVILKTKRLGYGLEYYAYILSFMYASYHLFPRFSDDSEISPECDFFEYHLEKFRIGSWHYCTYTPSLNKVEINDCDELLKLCVAAKYKYYPIALGQSYLNNEISIEELIAQTSLWDTTNELGRQKTIEYK
jgi:hypothetical protein